MATVSVKEAPAEVGPEAEKLKPNEVPFQLWQVSLQLQPLIPNAVPSLSQREPYSLL